MIDDQRQIQQVYLACAPTDMRKSINGLVVLVKEVFELDPFSPSWFVFCNRQRDKIKILRWDTNGFWLHYKRLERGHFVWPDSPSSDVLAVTRRQLRWLLDGLPLEQPQAHQEVTARTVI